MSYNTQFKVKYNDIKEELINKLKQKTSEEHEYSIEDVLDICNKLYIDELLSVFNIEDLNDDKIDNDIKYIYNIMMTNENFNLIINEMLILNTNEFDKNKEFTSEQQENLKQLVLTSLFSQHLFHITHKCICQQIETGLIDNELLVELRKYSIDLLKNKSDV